MDTTEWVRAARGFAKLTQEALGEQLGVTKGNVSGWENGRHSPSFEQMLRISAVTRVPLPLHPLVNGVRAEPQPLDLDAHPDLARVRRVQLRLQAGVSGFSIEVDESYGAPLFFRKDWLQDRGFKPAYLVAVTVMGQSMEPTLYQGDLVVINTADTEPKDGKVFAINYEGEAVIKRMVRDDGTWWITSDNPDARRFPRKLCADGGCIIIGRVVHRQSEEI